MIREQTRSAPLAAIILTGIVSVGCTYALGPRVITRGREFPRDQLGHLIPGLSESEVQKHLGEPDSRNVAADHVTLTYRAEYQQRACDVLLFGLIPIERRPRERYTLTLEFGPRGLNRASYTEQVEPKPAVTRLLVSSAR